MNFSVNQVKQLYVAKSVASETPTTKGELQVGETAAKDAFYILHYGAAGLTRSDLIKGTQVKWATLTKAADLAYTTKSYDVTLADADHVIAGQDYLIRIRFKQYLDLSDESEYLKYGVAHATSADVANPGILVAKLAKSLYQNFTREVSHLLDFYVDGTKITPQNVGTFDIATGEFNGTALTIASKITIAEVSQESEWIQGLAPLSTVDFAIEFAPITYNADEVTDWATIAENATLGVVTVGDGYKLADLEYFAHGERGDTYRMAGYPNYIPTKYDVDPTSTYDVITIHYFYEGPLDSVQKAEKDLVIVVPDGDTTISAAINTALKDTGSDIQL